MSSHTRALIVALTAWLASPATSAAAAYPIAGLKPSERPEGAPRITEVQRDSAWWQQALYGVSLPIPASLGFLEHQGNWYTPFNRPGMPGRYDLRGWYQRK